MKRLLVLSVLTLQFQSNFVFADAEDNRRSCEKLLLEINAEIKNSSQVVSQIDEAINAGGDLNSLFIKLINSRTQSRKDVQADLFESLKDTGFTVSDRAMKALQAVADRRRKSGSGIHTDEDVQILNEAKEAMAVDPALGQWSTSDRSQVYWLVGQGGLTPISVVTAISTVGLKILEDQSSVTDDQKQIMFQIFNLGVEISAWDQAFRISQDVKDVIGSVTALEEIESNVFKDAITAGLMPNRTDKEINDVISTRFQMPETSLLAEAVVRSRAKLTVVAYEIDKATKNAADAAKIPQLQEIYAKLYDVASKIALIEILSTPDNKIQGSKVFGIYRSWNQQALIPFTADDQGDIYQN